MGFLIRKAARGCVWLACALCLLSAFPTFDHAGAQANDPSANIVVIVSTRAEVRGMSLAVVRSIFMGVPTYAPSGNAYVPLTQPPQTPVRVAFDEQFLGMDPNEVGRYWVDQRIRARATPPRTIPAVDTLRRVVATLPEAISYIRADELRPGVVPLTIDDVDFRDARYRYKVSQLLQAKATSGELAHSNMFARLFDIRL